MLKTGTRWKFVLAALTPAICSQSQAQGLPEQPQNRVCKLVLADGTKEQVSCYSGTGSVTRTVDCSVSAKIPVKLEFTNDFGMLYTKAFPTACSGAAPPPSPPPGWGTGCSYTHPTPAVTVQSQVGEGDVRVTAAPVPSSTCTLQQPMVYRQINQATLATAPSYAPWTFLPAGTVVRAVAWPGNKTLRYTTTCNDTQMLREIVVMNEGWLESLTNGTFSLLANAAFRANPDITLSVCGSPALNDVRKAWIEMKACSAFAAPRPAGCP